MSKGKFVLGALVGAAAGVVAGILTAPKSGKETRADIKAKAKEMKEPNYQVQAVWSVSENTGRRYAMTSGDFNLIHIHAVTAKAFGFKQAIAHGMWSKARVLASLNLADAYEADVFFKLPMYLPSKVEFLTAVNASETDFMIRSAKNKKPHVTGTVTAL